MQLFYDPDLKPGPVRLRDSEAAHAARVLRKRAGDSIDLVDGKGGWYTATITNIDKRECWLDATLVRQEEQRADHLTTLLIAPTKNIDRFEWALEKATEIGVDRIFPIITAHSERSRVRRDRMERVIETAVKQCLRAWVPEVYDLMPFSDAIDAQPAGHTKYLPYLGADNTTLLRDTYGKGHDVILAVGPEGGFSPEEAEMAASRGFTHVSLGPNRLRTETAAAVALHTVESINW